MSNSSLVNVRIPAHSSNYTKGRTAKITEITIHHMAGILTVEQCGKVFQKVGRNGSSHYGIGSDGRIGLYVDEENTAWTNSNWDSNCRAVTIETSNCELNGEWKVSDEALSSLIKLVADIAKRNNLGTLVKGQNLTWHRMYSATNCPGDYLLSKMDYIAKEANKIISGQNTAEVQSKPAETIVEKIDVKYQAYVNGSWLADVTNYNDTADGYAGVYGKTISGLRANTVGTEEDAGKLIYRVHTINGKWLDEVTDREKDKNGDNYAGILDRAIDGVMIKSTKGTARYRVHIINGSWLPWVSGYNINDSINGYAGNLGHAIDGIQIEIV